MSNPTAPEQAAPTQRWFEIRNAAGDEADVLIFNEIGAWGLNALAFAREMKGVTAKKINLRINSPGGSVFDGTAIYNTLRAHGAKITVHVDGLAASIASVIAMSGDKIVMAKNAYMMIHNPAGGQFGDAAEMRKMADLLDKIRDTLAQTYADRSGKKTKAEFIDLMNEETWFTAKEAKAAGLADVVTDADGEPIRASADLAIFNKAPLELRMLLAPPPKPERPTETLADAGVSGAAIPPTAPTGPEEITMSQNETTPAKADAVAELKNEPKPATIKELRAAFPKDPDFALDAADKALTLIEAKAAYADVLQAKLDAVAAAPAAPAEEPKAKPEPVGNKALGGNAAAGADAVEFGTAKAEFNAAVRKLVNSGEYDQATAVRFVAKNQAELYQRVLDEANPK